MENINEIKTYIVNNTKEFKELAKNREIHEAYIEYTCHQCGRIHKVHKAYGKGTKSDNHYYKIIKWEDNQPLICPWCLSTNNFRKTQASKGEDIIQKEFSKRWKTRKEGISNQEEIDSQIVYTSFEELEKAFNNGIKGATVICPDCEEKKIIKGRQNLYHFINHGNINHDLRCKGCGITKTKLENSFKRIIIDPAKLFDCTFVEGQKWYGCNFEDENGNNVKREDRRKYKFKCNTCDSIFEDSLPCGYEKPVMCSTCHPLTSGETTTSSIEKELLNFIKINYKGEILTNIRDIIPPYEIDIYLPELKLGIEMNGVYWHSDVFKPNNYHLIKYEMCKKRDIFLIQLFEDSWRYNPLGTQSYLRHQLHIYSKYIDINNCIIQEIKEIPQEKDFLNQNNFYGYIPSDKCYGLYFEDELVAIISYKENNNGWNVERFCCKSGYYINNAFKTLFLNTHPKGKYLISLDKSLFKGSTYSKLLKFQETTEPYFYYSSRSYKWEPSYLKSERMISKHPEFKDLSIEEIAGVLNYHKVYDCGRDIFTYED